VRPYGERGSATLAAVAFTGVLLLLGAALGAIAALVVAHRSAQAGADLAALAAASAAADGRDACGAAGDVAAANAGSLEACQVRGREVRVSVRVDGPHWLGLDTDPVAEARAGPS
jgi:secretion/DNA translocation related TadE-like protein